MKISHKSWIDQQVQSIITTFANLSKWRWFLGVTVVLGAVWFVPTVAEFIVALHNRYRVYPSDIYETSMLAKSIGLTGVLSLAAAFLVGYIWKLVIPKWYITVLCILLSGLVCMVDSGVLWVGIPAMVIFGVTMGVSFWTKIPPFVPILAFCIVLLARPSMLPTNWCEYELTMYPCSTEKVLLYYLTSNRSV